MPLTGKLFQCLAYDRMSISVYEWKCKNAFICVFWSYYSYLSMIAHRSRLTFSKAPIVPFSTSCKSAGWSSTKIACMQPWKDRWEGGNNVWRKYPENNKQSKQKHNNFVAFFVMSSKSKMMVLNLDIHEIWSQSDLQYWTNIYTYIPNLHLTKQRLIRGSYTSWYHGYIIVASSF